MGVSYDDGATWTWVCATGHECPVAAEQALAEHQREAREAFACAMEQAGILPAVGGMTMDDFSDSPAILNYIHDREYRDGGGGAYVFSRGRAGTGKTTAAMAIAAQCLREGCTAMVESEPMIIARLQATMSHEGESVLDAISRFTSSWMLVIDDIGKAKASDWQLSQLCLIVDERTKARKPTVYTSQYDLGELESRWAQTNPAAAEAICSRIQGATVPIEMAGRDMRRM